MRLLYNLELFLLVLLSFAINSIASAQQDTNPPSSYTLLWQLGTGQGIHLAWNNSTVNLAISTSRGVSIYNQELSHVRQLSDISTITGQLVWSTEGNYLVSTTPEQIVVQESSSGHVLTSIRQPLVWSLAWRPEFDQFATGHTDENGDVVKLWDATTGNQIATLSDFPDRVVALDWDPTGQYLVAGTRSGSVVIYDMTNSQRLQEWQVPNQSIQSIAWNPYGNDLAISSLVQPFLTLWDTTSYELIPTESSPNFTGKIAWQSNGQYLAGRLDTGCVGIWNLVDDELFALNCGLTPMIDFAWHEYLLAVLYRDGRVEVWDSQTRQLLAEDQLFSGDVTWAVINPQQPIAAIAYEATTDIHLVSTVDGTTQSILSSTSPVAPSDLSDIAWSSDGQQLAVAFNTVLEIWNWGATPSSPIIVNQEAGQSPKLAWIPGETHRLSVAWGDDNDRGLFIINSQNGSVEEHIPIGGLLQLRWRPDGEQLAIYRYISPTDPSDLTSSVQILEADTYEEGNSLSFLEMMPTPQFMWLPDGSELLGIECNRVTETCGFWNWVENGDEVRSIVSDLPENSLGSVPFNLDPSGMYIAVGDVTRPQAYILRRDTMELLLILNDLVAPPNSITWDNEGKLYITDGTLRVYEIE
jgi:WD40 repeat protein